MGCCGNALQAALDAAGGERDLEATSQEVAGEAVGADKLFGQVC